jgi:tyrosyl-tRNA synthetase
MQISETTTPSFFEEIIGLDELRDRQRTRECLGYVGVEPSGDLHLGYLVLIRAIKWLEANGIRMKVLIADLHAEMNDKGDPETIRDLTRNMIETFRRYGVTSEIIVGSHLVTERYLPNLVKICHGISLPRFRRCLTIQGREERYLDENPLSLLYAMMQLNDIFEIGVDVCLSGMDQRRLHVLAREVASRRKLESPSLFHIRLLNDLRMKGKMSKSNPSGAIFLNDSHEEVRRKIKKGYLSPDDDRSPLYEIISVFGNQESLSIDDERLSVDQIKERIRSGKLLPIDLKNAVTELVIELLSEVSNE